MNLLNQNIPDPMPNNFSDKRKRKKNVCIAISVFLATLGIAGWSTYTGIKKITSNSPSANASQNSDKKVPTKAIPKRPKETPEDSQKSSKESDDSHDQVTFKSKSLQSEEENSESDDELQLTSAEISELPIEYPADNNVLKEFSGGKPVYSKTLSDWRTHDGTDFKAELGSTVKSITGGTVKDICNDSSYGTTAIIEHDGKFTAYYSGLNPEVKIKKGDKVKPGQEIGTVGNVPCEILDESHLHLMISKDEKFIDPLLILDKENR